MPLNNPPSPGSNTIPSYPAPARALDGSETFAGWQDGAQRAITANAIATFAGASVAPYRDQAQASAQAASDAVNRWQVEYTGPITIDPVAGTVTFPGMVILRDGLDYKIVNPADYGLTGFVVGLAPGVNSNFFYIDVSMVAPAQTAASPVKTATNGAGVAASATKVPLGASGNNRFSDYWGGERVRTDQVATLPLANVTLGSGEIKHDRLNLLGGGLAWYVPLTQLYDALIDRDYGTPANTASTELAGYAKLVRNPYDPEALVYNTGSRMLSMVRYDALPALLRASAATLLVLAVSRADTINSSLRIRQTDEGLGRNLLAGGKAMVGPTIVTTDGHAAALVQQPLLDLGLTQGWQSDAGANAAIGSMIADGYTQGTRAVIRYYVETTVDNAFGNAAVYMYRNDEGPEVLVPLPVIEQQISARVRMYRLDFTNTLQRLDKFYVVMFAVAGAQQTIAGVQYHVSKTPAYDIRRDDYPDVAVVAVTTDQALAARDAANLQRSVAMKTRIVSNVQTPTAPYNLLIMDGQSRAAGQETYPRLSTTAYGGNKMLGQAPVRYGLYTNTYPTFGDVSLHDLVAQVVDGSTHQTILTDAQVAALPAGDAAFGEPMSLGWANGSKWYLNQHLLTANDATRTYVTINAAQPGQGIARFLKPSGPWYGSTLDGVSKVSAAVGAGNLVVSGIVWHQGDYDYTQDSDGINDKAVYKASLNKLFDDYETDYRGVTGQALPIAKLIVQTDVPGYVVDLDRNGKPGLAIGMAQLETALERADTYMVGAAYNVTNKGAHLDSNGSRWMGWQIAKVYHRVVQLGQGWQPLRPIRIEQQGTAIFVDFHVPEPPLVFDQPYNNGDVKIAIAQKGFRVTDGDGTVEVPVSAVTLVGQTIVRLDLDRATTGTVNVWYASATTNGAQGMLRDSDPTVSRDVYTYLPNSGMYADANVPELVGKPYPLWNWCVAFFYPVGLGM